MLSKNFLERFCKMSLAEKQYVTRYLFEMLNNRQQTLHVSRRQWP